MARISTIAVTALTELLAGPNGLPDRVAQASATSTQHVPAICANEIVERHVAADLAEKTSGVRYPSVHVYCDKVVNELREKFRRFSGTADLVIEIRISHEHMDDLQSVLQTYAEAVTDVLDSRRGQWAPGVFYTGGYTVQYGPVKRGGRSFLQSAKVELTVNGSVE
jgi:hypothetical protein